VRLFTRLTRFALTAAGAIGLAVVQAAAEDAPQAGAAPAVKPAWDQIENVKEAAAHIAKLHRAQGAQKAVGFIDACYRTHSLASSYSRPYEACIAGDYILAQSLAAVYSQLPAEELMRRGAPQAAEITKSMGERVAAAFQHYNISPADAHAVRLLIEKHGMPVYVGIVFPKSEGQPGSAGEAKKKSKKGE